ncbi:MAG: ankyrin repeat domain-containing protein [Sterolibacterium sp.]
MKRLHRKTIAAVIAILLSGCASTPQKIALRPVSEPQPVVAGHKASFECREAEKPLQEVVCADEMLSALDHEMAQSYRQNLRSLDLVGRMQLIANQRRWLLSRAPQCQVADTRLGIGKPDPAQVSCLKTRYAARIAELKAWPQPQARKLIGARFHPLGAYVEFRVVDDRDPAICRDFAKRFNDAISDNGALDFSRMGGFAQIAGSHGVASASSEGHRYDVALNDAGPYASYQMRAYGLGIDGQARINDNSLGEWISQLPNSGGRFGSMSSQTRDYAAIDVFGLVSDNTLRRYALATETWGYYSAGARGESAYAGLYDVSGGSAQPRCLYQTYLTPPIHKTFDNLPAYKELAAALDVLSGDIIGNLAADERRDETLLQRETEWILFNMPLVVLADAERFGRTGALRQRHDAALEAIFNWSERNVPSKLHYRRLMPLIQPAQAELITVFQRTQGLKPDEAAAAADLLLIDVIDRAAESLGDYAVTAAAPLAPFANYQPRYAVAPAPGDLERGRRIATLHSALINRAGPEVINDFIRYEFAAADRPRGLGPAGDTALMAAVRVPEAIRQLLAAGIDVNASNEWHKTALMVAAQTNQLASVQLLLDAGASVNAATIAWHRDGAGSLDNEDGGIGGRTALMYAAANGNVELLQLLLQHGAKPGMRDGKQQTACAYLERNALLQDQDKAVLKPLLCLTE